MSASRCKGGWWRETNGLAWFSSLNHRCYFVSAAIFITADPVFCLLLYPSQQFHIFPPSVIRSMRRKLKCEIEFLQWTKRVLRGSSPPFMLCASNSSSLVQPASPVRVITLSTLCLRSRGCCLYVFPFCTLLVVHLFFVSISSHATDIVIVIMSFLKQFFLELIVSRASCIWTSKCFYQIYKDAWVGLGSTFLQNYWNHESGWMQGWAGLSR